MTQENIYRQPGHEEYQELVTLCGQELWVDRPFVPLLKAMNEAGLRTRSHCCGHGSSPAWVVIRLDNIIGIEILRYGEYNEVRLTWQPAESHPT